VRVNGFSWVIENEIAGMARPDSRSEGVWAWLSERGIGLVVSLTTGAPDADMLAKHGLELVHLPVEDFRPPTARDFEQFLSHARFARHEGKGIVVHCGAGMGRTGTMLAAYLIDKGMTAAQAISTVRDARPGSIETSEQEQALHDLQRRLRG
jgi:atypical dual specificity phosphatase